MLLLVSVEIVNTHKIFIDEFGVNCYTRRQGCHVLKHVLKHIPIKHALKHPKKHCLKQFTCNHLFQVEVGRKEDQIWLFFKKN